MEDWRIWKYFRTRILWFRKWFRKLINGFRNLNKIWTKILWFWTSFENGFENLSAVLETWIKLKKTWNWEGKKSEVDFKRLKRAWTINSDDQNNSKYLKLSFKEEIKPAKNKKTPKKWPKKVSSVIFTFLFSLHWPNDFQSSFQHLSKLFLLTQFSNHPASTFLTPSAFSQLWP